MAPHWLLCKGAHHIRPSGLTYFPKHRDPNEHGGPYKDDKTGSGLIFWEPYTQNEQRYLSLGESSLPSFFGLTTINAIFRIAAHHGPLDTDESVCSLKALNIRNWLPVVFSFRIFSSFAHLSRDPGDVIRMRKKKTYLSPDPTDFQVSNSVEAAAA
jgi:hypothetical protein